MMYLEDQSPLCSEAVLQEEGALVACHAVEEHSQHSTQNTLLQLRGHHSLTERHHKLQQDISTQ